MSGWQGYALAGLLQTLTGDNHFSGGTSAEGMLQIGDGTTSGLIYGVVAVGTELLFDVAPGAPEVFNGQVTGGIIGGASLVKTGSGELELIGDASAGGNLYSGATRVEDGTLQLGDATALPASTTVIVDSGATLDLNGFSPSYPISAITLIGGSIVDNTISGATIAVAGLIELGAGTISANLSGAVTLLKADDATGGTTATLSGTDDISGTTEVLIGTLEVNGTLGSPSALPSVIVDAAGVLSGAGDCLGGVFIDRSGTGGTLEMDTSIGPSFTMGSLTIDPGATIIENANVPVYEVAIVGTLTINGATDSSFLLLDAGAQSGAAFQTLIRYGTLTTGSGSVNDITPPSGDQLFDDVVGKSIELNGGTTSGTSPVVYWAPNGPSPGGSGTWDPTSTTNDYWLPASGGAATTWTSGDVAIFTGSGGTVMLQSTPSFTAIYFESGDYTLDGVLQSSSGLLAKTGGGSVVLGSSDAVSAVTVTGGMLDVGDRNTLTVNGAMTLAAGIIQGGIVQGQPTHTGSVAANSFLAAQGTIGAILADHERDSPLAVASNADGNSVILTATNTYTGPSTINAGAVLQAGDGSNGDDGVIPVNNANGSVLRNTITDNGTLQFHIYSTAEYGQQGAYIVGQNITGLGGVTNEGGVVVFSGTNNYQGVTVLLQPELQVISVNSLPDGGALQLGAGAAITFSAPWPTSSVHALQSAGNFGLGNEIDIAVPFGQNVAVTGTPELPVAAGPNAENAQYVSGSGTSTLVFRYIVQPGDSTPALDLATGTISLNGGTIDDTSGNPVSLAIWSSLSIYERLAIDTTAPAVSNVALVGPATTNANSVQFVVNFSKPVFNVTPGDFALASSTVTGNIADVTGGGTQYVVTVDNLSGTGTLGLNVVDDDSITDVAGNPLGGAALGTETSVVVKCF